MQLSSTTIQTLSSNTEKVISFLPQLFVAVVIFILGWFISVWLGKLLAKILRILGLEKLFDKKAWRQSLEESKINVDISGFIGLILRWSLMIIFLTLATDIIGLHQFTDFLNTVVLWLPNLVAAILIFIATAIFAEAVSHLVKVSINWSRVGYSRLAGTITKSIIWLFAIFAIFRQLQIMPEISLLLNKGIIYLIFGSLSVAIGLGLGLSFGLGGKDMAAEALKKWRKKSSKKNSSNEKQN